MRRVVAFVLLVACHNASPARPVATASATASASASIAPPAPWADGETDYEGTFNAAKLHLTLDHRSGAVTGSLFYDAFGTAIAVRGTFASGALVLYELDEGRPISTTTLTRAADGSFSGEWVREERRGPASLVPIQATRVVARREKTSTRCDAETFADGSTKRVTATVSLEIPVVLGIEDRGFEHTLNEALAKRAHTFVPSCPLGIDVSFATPLVAHGFVGVIFTGVFAADKSIGMNAYSHTSGVYGSLVADIEGKRILDNLSDVVDRAKVPKEIRRVVRDANAMCVTGPADDPFDLMFAFVPTGDGAEYCFDTCMNDAHAPRCASVKSGVHAALKSLLSRLQP